MNNIRWEDLVFANRNQAYGAYPLRKAYSSRVTMSFAFAMTAVAMMLSFPVIKSLFESEVVVSRPTTPDGIVMPQPPPIIELIPLVPPPQVHAPVEQIRFVPPVVTQLDVADLTPTIEELQNADVSNQNLDGANVIIETPVTPEPPPAVENDEGKIWLNPQQQPEFPGGVAEMMKFIGKHIRYPSSARRMNIAGNVFVSFVVNADGTIDKVELLKGIYGDCDNEAMRVIGKMPTWKPGKQNGKAVKVKLVLPIKFALTGV
jgi:protein TonB